MVALRHVLVVDDNRLARETMRAALAGVVPDSHVVAVETGGAALASVDQDPPDMAFIDLGLQGMDGFNLIRALRDRLPNLPVCVVSASIHKHIQEKVSALGVRFIEKPVTQVKLKAVLGS